MPQPTLEPLRRWDPERIGPYALLGRLGAGAMGQVYLGRSAASRLVAVKTIKIELAEEAGFRDHFAHEVAAARKVSGLFTAAVVAADPEANVPWLATAYVPAPSLSRLVRAAGPQPVATIWWLAAGCAEALESIHGVGLVHRDLKPSNVLVAPDGPRVIDFGVARAAERIQLTVTRGAVGTPAYMAPEQARDTRQASMASDVFALGATLLFAATGHPPYQGETVMDVLVRLATEPPDLTGLPAELADIIHACLERSPRDRPTSAAVLERAGPYIEGAPGVSAGHAFLADSAMALIREYQRIPQADLRADPAADASDPGLRTGTGTGLGSDSSLDGASSVASHPSVPSDPAADNGDSSTYASHLAVQPPVAVPAPPAQTPPAQAPPPGRRGGGGRGRRRHDAVLGLPGRATAAVVLIAAGAGLGVLLSRSSDPPASKLSGGAQTSSAIGGDNPPAGVPGAPPPTTLPSLPAGQPAVGMFQPTGDPDTDFAVHGLGWLPGSRVSIELVGHGTDPYRPTVDMASAFNYLVNQDHAFFAGTIPPGTYEIIVTGAGRRRARTRFTVLRPPQPSPGAGSPPAGAGSPPPQGSRPPASGAA
jgi:serine/threonine protein kinase